MTLPTREEVAEAIWRAQLPDHLQPKAKWSSVATRFIWYRQADAVLALLSEG